jgi:hypothetical protein
MIKNKKIIFFLKKHDFCNFLGENGEAKITNHVEA